MNVFWKSKHRNFPPEMWKWNRGCRRRDVMWLCCWAVVLQAQISAAPNCPQHKKHPRLFRKGTEPLHQCASVFGSSYISLLSLSWFWLKLNWMLVTNTDFNFLRLFNKYRLFVNICLTAGRRGNTLTFEAVFFHFLLLWKAFWRRQLPRE